MSTKSQSRSSKSNSSSYRSTDLAGSKLNLPLSYGGLGNIFFDQLSNESEKILQVDTMNNITENKGSVKVRSVRLAIEMKARGVEVNDIILISSKIHAHQTIVLLSTLFIGAIVCPISTEAPYKDCLNMVKELKPKMCFCDARSISQIDRILHALDMASIIVNFGNEIAGTVQFIKLFPIKEDANFKPVHIESPHKEVAFILPTQGTSQEPKLVCLSHHNIYTQALNFMELFENPSKVISFFPLSYLTQTVMTCASLEYGFTRIMVAGFNERAACKMIHDFIIDVAILGTDLALRLTQNVAVNDYNLSCLKCALVGVVNTTQEDLYNMRKVLPNVKFVQCYTLTEAGCIAAVPSSNYSAAMERPSSVGKLLKNCRIKIIDVETKQPLGAGKFGELYFKGDGLMLGYFRDGPGTLAAIEKGFFRTGDLAKYDEQGWIYLQGRINDMICVNNTKISPLQIESIILLHPSVHDVVIIGNETQLVACVEPKPNRNLTTENIKMYISKKLPDYEKLFTKCVIMELPRTNTGNVKRAELRDEILGIQIEYTRSLASISTTKIEVSSTRDSRVDTVLKFQATKLEQNAKVVQVAEDPDAI